MKKLSFWTSSIIVAVLLCISGAGAFAQGLAAPQNLMIRIIVPENPTDLTGAVLSWDAVTDAEGYRVYVRSVSNDTDFEFIGETQETEYTLDQRFDVNSAAYAYRVTAFAGDDESEPSNVVSSACGRPWNEGDIGSYVGSGITRIVSSPTLKVAVGQGYNYDANAIGEYSKATPSGSINYSISGPEGMRINPTTGVVQWVPNTVGKYTVVITVRAVGVAEFDQQMWNLDVVSEMTTDITDNTVMPHMVLSPNPASSSMSLRFPSTAGENVVVAITDLSGQKVQEISVRTNAIETVLPLNVGTMANGLYLLRITSASGATTTKSFTVAR